MDTRVVRILHVVGGMNRGGIETWLMHVLRHIDRDRCKMDFLVHTDHPCAYDEEIRSLGSKIIPCLNPSRPWTYARKFTQILRKHGPYAVVHSHVHHFSGYVVRLAQRAGVPLRISHSHNDTTNLEAHSGMLRHAYLALMKRWIERHASLGIACSREAAIALFGLTWEANPRRRILYYGIDLSPFQTVPDSGKIRTELGIPPDALVIGHVGRFSQQKNHAFLIVIFSELIKLQPDAYLLLVGDGELRPDIERRVDEAGLSTRVLFLGSRPDVPSLMKGTVDVFLFPSLYEGLPLVLIEAQAACLPCIIADTVPVEVDIVKPLIRRVGLDTPPAIWAGTLVNHLSSVPTDLKAINVLKGSPFTIESSVSALAEVYGG